MARHSVRERLAALDIFLDLTDYRRQRGVLRLLRQDAQRLGQRQAGVDHGGKLAAKDGDVFSLDFLLKKLDAAGLLGRGLFLDVDDGVAHLPELADDISYIVALNRAVDHLSGPVPAFVRVT